MSREYLYNTHGNRGRGGGECIQGFSGKAKRMPLERLRPRWEDNTSIKVDLGVIRWGDIDWINLAQDTDQ
jgi:hypothetical protein